MSNISNHFNYFLFFRENTHSIYDYVAVFLYGDYLDDEYIPQREIEKEIFEKFGKISERSLSILKLIFVVSGFYSVIFVYMYGKLDIDLILRSSPYPPESTYSIKLCFIMLILAFMFSFKPLTMERYKFVETKRSIRYREGPELEKNNRRVALNVRRLSAFNMISIYCIIFSFSFFISYFIGKDWFFVTSGSMFYAAVRFIEEWIAIYYIEKEGREEL